MTSSIATHLAFYVTISLILSTPQVQSLDQVTNLSNYNYPLPEQPPSRKYTVAVISTNDLHGHALPHDATSAMTQVDYSFGGLEFLVNQINTIRSQWGDRSLWLDGGDEFTGGFETKLSKGELITETFNLGGLDAAAIGNHEFDYGRKFLDDRIQASKFEYLSANIANEQGQPGVIKNTKASRIYTLGEIKLGVIGIATLETMITTSGDLSGLNFLDYKPVIEKEAKELRDNGAHSVIIIGHIGMYCYFEDAMINKIRDITEEQDLSKCTPNELTQLLDSLEPGTIDGVVGGHTHKIGHHWYNGFPVVSNVNNGGMFHVLYLTFDLETKSILPNETKIEGPVPVCSKIFTSISKCNIIRDDLEPGDYVHFLFHNKIIRKDLSLKGLYTKWYKELEQYRVPLAKTKVRLFREQTGDFILGNVFNDCMQSKAKADVSIYNPGGFRSIWLIGNIDEVSFIDMFPFRNKQMRFVIKGNELKRLLETIQVGKKGIYTTAGVVTHMTLSPKKVTKVTLADGSEIVDDKDYSVTTNSFLIQGYGDDFRLVKDWLKPELTEIGIDDELFKECLVEKGVIDGKTSTEYKRVVIED